MPGLRGSSISSRRGGTSARSTARMRARFSAGTWDQRAEEAAGRPRGTRAKDDDARGNASPNGRDQSTDPSAGDPVTGVRTADCDLGAGPTGTGAAGGRTSTQGRGSL